MVRQNQKSVVFIICLLISVLFWFFTSLSRTFETVVTVPVSYQNIPFSMEMDRGLPTEIRYHYKGTGFELIYFYLKSGPDSITIDVGKNSVNGRTFNINSLSLAQQLGTEIDPFKALPETIESGLITRNKKRIPVIPVQDIRFRQRFDSTSSLVLVPDSVTISGPEPVLNSIRSIKTKPIQLKDVHQEVFSSILLENNLPEGVILSERYVYYYLQVNEFTEGEFEIPVELPPSQRGKVTLVPSHIRVKFTANLTNFPRIRASDFQAFTSVPFPETPALLPVQLRKSPKGISNVTIEPRLINYLIKE